MNLPQVMPRGHRGFPMNMVPESRPDSARKSLRSPACVAGVPLEARKVRTTKGPMWGYPRGRFWDLGTVLEPFCGKLLPKVDKPVNN